MKQPETFDELMSAIYNMTMDVLDDYADKTGKPTQTIDEFLDGSN